MANPYILAKTMKDAHAFARDFLDLRPGRYRVVTSSSSISGPRNADLYLVPGWEKRHDRFALKGAMRYTRLNVIDGSELEPKGAPEQTDGLNPPGVQLSIVDDASAFFDNAVPSTAPPAEDWKAELEKHLEPVGFALSDDPQVQARQIIESAAAEADRNSLLQAMSDEVAEVEEKDVQFELPAEPPAPAEPEKKRRRTRCKSCNTLHFKDESCPEAE